MMGFFIFIASVIITLFTFHILTKKFINPYTLTMIFGKKGSGKSTLLTKLAMEYMKKGHTVYSTMYIKGAYQLDYKDVGYVEMEENSIVFVDEVGMIWDNRNFKNFDNKVRDWFKLQRHRKIRVYLFSQTFDVDKKIRDLTDEMYLVEKKLRVFSYAKCIYKKIVLNKSSSESPSKIDEDLVFAPLLLFLFGARKFTYIPKYIKHFDSYEAPRLQEKEFEQWGAALPIEGIDDEADTLDPASHAM